MLQKLRDQTQGIGFKILVGALIFVLAIFGFGAFNLFVTGEPEVASVNGHDITQAELIKAAEREQRRLAIELGDQFDASQIDLGDLQASALEQLIGRTLLAQALEDLGMEVSDERVNASIRDNPAFQVDGRYDANAYRRMVQVMRFTPQDFLREHRMELALTQLQEGIADSAFLTEWEMAQTARLLNQRRDLAYLEFSPDDFIGEVDVGDEQVRLRYDENALDYRTVESADVSFVELSAVGLLDDSSIEVTPEDVESTYAAEVATAVASDQRSSRPILLEVGDDRTEEAAITTLTELKQRLRDGADFAELAREYSEDLGSASQGGSLGLLAKGVIDDPQFEEALWSLEQGEVSDPVRTQAGYHLIELVSIEISEFPAIEVMGPDIEQRLRMEQAELLFAERLRELDGLAFEEPESLEGISEALGLAVQTVDGVTRAEGADVFGNAELRDATFSTDVLVRGYNSPAIELSDYRAVVLRVDERYDPAPIPFEAVAADIRAALVVERARALAEAGHASALERVRTGESVSDVARDFGLQWETFPLSRRTNAEVPATVLMAAFEMQRPMDVDKSVGQAQLPDGGIAVVTVTHVEEGDILIMPDREIADMRSYLKGRIANLDFVAFYDTLEQDASIDRSL